MLLYTSVAPSQSNPQIIGAHTMNSYPHQTNGGKKPHSQAPRTLSSVHVSTIVGAAHDKALIARLMAGKSGEYAKELRDSLNGFTAMSQQAQTEIASAFN